MLVHAFAMRCSEGCGMSCVRLLAFPLVCDLTEPK
jgi:hypothetical protein